MRETSESLVIAKSNGLDRNSRVRMVRDLRRYLDRGRSVTPKVWERVQALAKDDDLKNEIRELRFPRRVAAGILLEQATKGW